MIRRDFYKILAYIYQLLYFNFKRVLKKLQFMYLIHSPHKFAVCTVSALKIHSETLNFPSRNAAGKTLKTKKTQNEYKKNQKMQHKT